VVTSTRFELKHMENPLARERLTSSYSDQRWRGSRKCCDPAGTQCVEAPGSCSDGISDRNNRLLQSHGRDSRHRPQERPCRTSQSAKPKRSHQVSLRSYMLPQIHHCADHIHQVRLYSRPNRAIPQSHRQNLHAFRQSLLHRASRRQPVRD